MKVNDGLLSWHAVKDSEDLRGNRGVEVSSFNGVLF